MSQSALKHPTISLDSRSSVERLKKKIEPEYNWRVLIVEDEASIAEGIKNIIVPPPNVLPLARSSRQRSTTSIQTQVSAPDLPKDQFEVTWAKNPKEALDLVRQSIENKKPFAMGFFDVLLGADIDGIELVKEIHKIDPKIYAVFVTAYHDRTVDSINQILGADKSDRWDYMNKPFTDGAILQKARNAVSTWNLRRQKEMQDEQLAEAANLFLQEERANSVAAVGRSVAHEFGNILMRIIGNAEIALMKRDPSDMQEALSTILRAGETATSVLDKFKKVQSGEEGFEFQKINVAECMNEALDLMSHELKKRSIAINRHKYENCEIEANYHSLIQVFINVLINSTHVMPDSGAIDVSIESFNNHHDVSVNNSVQIVIRDWGPGIPEDILPKVMDPFFTTKGKKGTGLGLPICREIIEHEHAGKFTIQNHPEKGIQVIIHLPIKQEVTDVSE